MLAFEGKKGEEVRPVLADSTGNGRSGGLHSGVLVGMGHGRRPPIWTPTRLE